MKAESRAPYMRICPGCGHRHCNADWHCPACGTEPQLLEGFRAFAPQYAYDAPGFHPEYFEALAELESRNFWFRARNRQIIRLLRTHFPGLKDYLEVGCGTGFVLSGVASAFPDARLAGTELFCAGLGYAARRIPEAEFLQVDARHIPYEAEFDVVGAFDVLEHIPEDEGVMSQMYQVVKPGGGIVVTVPQHPWLWSRQDELAGHVRRYTATELRDKITRAGFRVVEIRSFVSLLLPVLWLSRRLDKAGAGVRDPLAELRLGRFVDTLFSAVMAVEYALGRLGLVFPAGGSLVLVGYKE